MIDSERILAALLLEAGADPEARANWGATPLDWAGVLGSRAAGAVLRARDLLARGADVDSRGFFDAPALHWAAINGHAETIAFLLEQGADPALHDAQFDSDALGWAREGGHARAVALLAGGG